MKKTYTKILKAALILALLVTLSLTLVSCFDNTEPTEPLYEKDAILAETLLHEDFSGYYAYQYLKEWRFPEFDYNKLQTIEKKFHTFYVEELPEAKTLALGMLDVFFEYYYEETDLHDKDVMTTALIECYIYTVGDDYAYYRTPEQYDDYSGDMSGEFVGIGVEVLYDRLKNTCRVEAVISGGGAEQVGILPGDYIIAVDDVPVSELGYEKTVSNIKGEIGTTVKITVLRGEKELSFSIVRKKIVEESVKYSIDQNKIGYIKITGFKSNTYAQFKEAITYFEAQGAVGVIYDLRSNPGGYLDAVVNMLSFIAPKGTELVSFSNNYAAPMYATDEHTYLVPTVVICNGTTASAGELFTAALRDFGASGLLDVTVVGEKTYGKGIMQNTYFNIDGSTLTLTVAYYNPPSKENYHGVGITPHVVLDDMEGALNAAYDEMNKLLNK